MDFVSNQLDDHQIDEHQTLNTRGHFIKLVRLNAMYMLENFLSHINH